MKNFRSWLEDNKSLAIGYKDALKDIPQNLNHHKEGSVLNHVRLVRKSVQRAIQELKSLKNNNPEISFILSDIDFNLSLEEQRIVNLAAWLHDIGKATSTKMDGENFDKKHLNWDKEEYQGKPLLSIKISSPEHERSKHYAPQIEKLKKEAPIEIVNLYESNKELFDFLIDNHMQFTNGPSKDFIKNNFENGKLKNEKRLKLLMVLMWADKMGRAGGGSTELNTNKLIVASKKNLESTAIKPSKKPFEGSVEDFKALLRSRGIPEDQIKNAVANKFGIYESFKLKKKKTLKNWKNKILDKEEDAEEDSYFKDLLAKIQEFENALREKGLGEEQIEKAVINKFGILKTEDKNMKFSEWLELREGKDACYKKVKSRYSVWPSAYASGALVRCRKVGAKNWGNKKKKKMIKEDMFANEIQESTFKLEKERGLKGWFDRNNGKGWIDCKASKKGDLVPCGRKKTGKGAEREYPACRPTLSACNKKGKKRKKSSERISWK